MFTDAWQKKFLDFLALSVIPGIGCRNSSVHW